MHQNARHSGTRARNPSLTTLRATSPNRRMRTGNNPSVAPLPRPVCPSRIKSARNGIHARVAVSPPSELGSAHNPKRRTAAGHIKNGDPTSIRPRCRRLIRRVVEIRYLAWTIALPRCFLFRAIGSPNCWSSACESAAAPSSSYHSAAAAMPLASNSSASEVMAMPSTSIAGNGRFVFTPRLRIRSPTESALPLPVDSRFTASL
jgi:hypothetical protein